LAPFFSRLKKYLVDFSPDEISAQIKQLEGLIKNYYNNKTEAAEIKSRVKWAEEGEKSTRYFFNLEKNGAKKSYGIGLKRSHHSRISLYLFF
jgi:hypothetical protein